MIKKVFCSARLTNGITTVGKRELIVDISQFHSSGRGAHSFAALCFVFSVYSSEFLGCFSKNSLKALR